MLAKYLVTILLLLSPVAWAQMWGTGMYGGMQACGYPQQVSQGAVSEDDSVREAREAISELQAQLKAKKSEKKKVDRQTDKARQDIEKGISDEHVGFVLEHIENSRQCMAYKDFQGVEQSHSSGDEGTATIPQGNMTPIQSFSLDEWRTYCDRSRAGSVNGALCVDAKLQKREGRSNASVCKKSLVEYRKNYALQDKLQGEIEDLEARIKDAKEEFTDARKQAAEDRKSNTEGGVCVECMARSNGNSVVQPQTNWASVIGNVGVGLASIYMGYKTNKMISNNNANLGWPTDPYATQGYGYGLGAIATGMGQVLGGGSGIYGSISGGMSTGSFGCAGNNGGPYGMMGPYGGMNGNGMWGNPYVMNSSLMFRMQQIQYGGSYLGSSLSGLGTGTSTYLTPLPGSSSSLTTLPGSLSTSGR